MSRAQTKKATQRSKSKGFGWGGFLVKLAVVLAVMLGGYMVYLDAVVQERFAGKRWVLPAKVYARPLELYAGLKLKQQDLVAELEALGYRRGSNLERPGSMSVADNHVELHARGFRFYDGEESAQRLRVRFAGGQVAELSGRDGQPVAVVRLDPLLIGSLYPAHQEDRILVRLDEVPQELIEALTIVEDRDFFSHYGVSLRSIARAVWVNASARQLRQGGSTLTQQLVKNFFLTSERSLSRKLNEALMALLLELHYDKNEILEAYLNEVFLGQDGNRAVHGFGLASQYYFNRPLQELDSHQIALLVGMVKGASYYSPRRYPERTQERRNLVLELMAGQGALKPQQLEEARKKPLGVTAQGSLTNTGYPAFMDLVKRQLREDYREADLTEEGLRIFTSMDPVLQKKAELALAETFARLKGSTGIDQVETALMAVRPGSGEVLAMLGSRQPRFAGFNRALDASRPVGSLVKPAVYLTALQQPERFSLTSKLQDTRFTVRNSGGRDWTPQNFDRKEHGSVFLYKALASSYNLSTARLGMDVGVSNVLDTVRRLGGAHDWPAYPSMLLGAGSLTPMQVGQMYQTLANGGFHTPLRAIHNVLTVDGEPLGRYPLHVEQRFDPAAIYLTRVALQSVMTEGTGRSAYNRLPAHLRVAGKTGTSNDSRDSWFAGFAEDLLAVAWMGRDDNGKTSLTGSTGSLRLWTEFVRLAEPASLGNTMPEGVRELLVDPVDGLAVTQSCEGVLRMPYWRGSEPPVGNWCQRFVPVEQAPLPDVNSVRQPAAPRVQPPPQQENKPKVRDRVRGWLGR